MSEEEKFEKESRDPMIKKLVKLAEADLKNRDVSFCIQGEELMIEEVSAHNGLLSLFLYKAANLCDETLKKRLPLYFELDKSALIEVVPMTENLDNNLFSLWTHFLHFSVEEEIRRLRREKKLAINGMIPLDTLYQDWHQAIKAGKFPVRPSTKVVPASSSGNN